MMHRVLNLYQIIMLTQTLIIKEGSLFSIMEELPIMMTYLASLVI